MILRLWFLRDMDPVQNHPPVLWHLPQKHVLFKASLYWYWYYYLKSPLWEDPQHRPVWARCRPSVWGRTAPPHRKSQSRGSWRHHSSLYTRNTGEGPLRGLQEGKHQQHRNRCHKTNIVHIFSSHQNNIPCFRCCFNEADSIVLLWAEYWICYSRERHL